MLFESPQVRAYDAAKSAAEPELYCSSPSGSRCRGFIRWMICSVYFDRHAVAVPLPALNEASLAAQAMSPAAATTGSPVGAAVVVLVVLVGEAVVVGESVVVGEAVVVGESVVVGDAVVVGES